MTRMTDIDDEFRQQLTAISQQASMVPFLVLPANSQTC